MTPTAEVAKELRLALKTELGLGPREVSVRTHSYSLGSSIDVTIKVPGILKDKVEEIAKRFACIQYDHATGEILCGGNRNVHVEYAHRLSLDLQAKYGALLPQEDGGEATIAPGATVRREREYFRFFLNGDEARYCWGEGLASIYWAELEIEAAAAAEAAAQLTGIDAAAVRPAGTLLGGRTSRTSPMGTSARRSVGWTSVTSSALPSSPGAPRPRNGEARPKAKKPRSPAAAE